MHSKFSGAYVEASAIAEVFCFPGVRVESHRRGAVVVRLHSLGQYRKPVTSLLSFTVASVALTPSSVVLGGRIHSIAPPRVPKLPIEHAKHS